MVTSNEEKFRLFDTTITDVELRQLSSDSLERADPGKHNTLRIQRCEELHARLDFLDKRFDRDMANPRNQFVTRAALKTIREYYTSDRQLDDEMVLIDFYGEFASSREYSITIRSVTRNETPTMLHVTY